jgi:hypothetical protein
MEMPIHYIQNIVPTKYTSDNANMCATNGDCVAETTCSNVNDSLRI